MRKYPAVFLYGWSALSLAVVAGCSTDTIAEKRLSCESGEALAVRWHEDSVEITDGQQQWELPRAISGSGARYANGQYELWEHQGEFSWTRPGAVRTLCHPTEAAAQ